MKMLYLLVFVLAMLIGLFISGCTAELIPIHWESCIKTCEIKKAPLVKIAKTIGMSKAECLCADGVWHTQIGKKE